MARRSISDSGPASSEGDRSLGRTNSPSDSAIRRARFPSSSMTDLSHWTADFSAFPFALNHFVDCIINKLFMNVMRYR